MDGESKILRGRNMNLQSGDNTDDPTDPNYGTSKRVAYIFNDSYLRTCDQLPKVKDRASMVHSLISAYGLLGKMRLISPRPATDEEVTLFHSTDYVECLKKLSKEEDWEKYEEEAETYGLTYDCPAYPDAYEYASYVAGATIKAAQCLMMGICDVAINWPGGWHHAKRDEAAGYCYINDIVVAILKLRQKYERILYVDLDLHHGDGVEDAFCATSKVLTVSFHKVSPGFFPGSGEIKDVGMGKGKYYSVSVPLQDGIQDEQYVEVFNSVISLVKEKYDPQAVVCQCGADGVHGDPMESYNLTPRGLVQCVQCLCKWNLPLLLVGGGGYHFANTARTWASITASTLGIDLPQEIPEHKFFTQYGPDYQLKIEQGNRANQNNSEYIETVISKITEHLQNIDQS